MARPKKNNADYFSHDKDMRDDRKIKALRSKYNILGYGVWCMLLEYLTGANNNEIKDEELEIELLAGDFGISVTEINNIINYCIKLGLLVKENGIIYSQSLKDRLAPVYEKRARSKSIYQQKQSNNGVSDTETEYNEVSDTETTQSKVKKSKVKKSKVKENKYSEFSFDFIEEEFKEPFIMWLDYKKQRNDTYKSQKSLEVCYKQLKEKSKNDPSTAMRIVEQSIGNNWAGLFEIKEQKGYKDNESPQSNTVKLHPLLR